MSTPNSEPLFRLGKLAGTPAALQAIQESGQEVSDFVNRHIQGDWSGLSEVDRFNNQEALATGDRIFSVFRTDNGTKIWIITEPENEAGERYMTNIVLPSEY